MDTVLSSVGTAIDEVIVISDTDVNGRGRPHGPCVDSPRSATPLIKPITYLSVVLLSVPDHKNGVEIDEESGLMA